MSGIRLLVIENSTYFLDAFLEALRARLPQDSLVESSTDPVDAKRKLLLFRPTVILLNFSMAVLTVDGTRFLPYLATQHDIPIISYGLIATSERTALQLGAASYICKPESNNDHSPFFDQVTKEICHHARKDTAPLATDIGSNSIVTREIWRATKPRDAAAAQTVATENRQAHAFIGSTAPAKTIGNSTVITRNRWQVAPAPPEKPEEKSTVSSMQEETQRLLQSILTPSVTSSTGSVELIAIGSSTGGTDALTQVLTELRPPLPPIVIVQHIPPFFSKLLSQRLNEDCVLSVKEAETGDVLKPNHVYIAPGQKHMTVQRIGTGIVLDCSPGEPRHNCCPSVDVLFDSVASEIGGRVIGVILTGMGKDGAEGLLKIRRSGAHTIGQDEETCVVYGMPRAAYELGAVEKQLPLPEIAAGITQLA